MVILIYLVESVQLLTNSSIPYAKIFSGDQPRQCWVEIQRFRDILRLYDPASALKRRSLTQH